MQKLLLAPNLELMIRLGLAAVLGSLIGIEREQKAWAAGLRTHMLVSVGACLFMLVSAFGFADVLDKDHTVLDPSRVAAQVASGIGFIGGGCILLRGDIVRGLTTAASLWTVAALGLAVGGGLYFAAGAATVMILAILIALKPFEEWLQHRNRTYEIDIAAAAGSMSYEAVKAALGYRATRITKFIQTQGVHDGEIHVAVFMRRLPSSDLNEVMDLIRALPGVTSAKYVSGVETS